jgi:hypothetical protein
LGVGYSLEVSYPLLGSLPAGDYVIAATGSTAQAGSELLHVDLVHRRTGASDEILAGVDGSIATSAPLQPATVQLTVHATAVAVACGDALVVRVQHPGGTQTLFPFELALDIP